MREVISRFKTFSVGSHGLLVLVVSLIVILYLMCSYGCKSIVCCVWVCEFCGERESCFCVFRVLFPICFLTISV